MNLVTPLLLEGYSKDKIMNVARILQDSVHCGSIIAIINNGRSLKSPKCLTNGAQLNEQRLTLEGSVITKTSAIEV